jgi:predicted MFS family arabinose efflux permease
MHGENSGQANDALVDASWDPAPGSVRRWVIFSLACAGLILSMFYRVSVAVISPSLADDLHLTSAQLGTLAAAFFYAFAFSQFPLGLALDRIGPRVTMATLGLVGVAGSTLFAFSHTFGQVVAGRLLLGMGMSCNLMGALSLIAAWFPVNRFAYLSGVLVALGVLGNMAAATPLVFLARSLGWRQSFIAIAMVNAIQVAAFYLAVWDRPGGRAHGGFRGSASLKGTVALFRNYSYWAISFAAFVRYGFFVALQGLWAGLFLMNGLGMRMVSAGNTILGMGLGIMVGLPFSGRLSDTWLRSRKHVVWPTLILFGLLALWFPFWDARPSEWLVYGAFFATGMLSATGQVMFAHIKELVPTDLTARAMTGVNFFVMLGGAVFTQLIGLVIGDDPSNLKRPGDFASAWYLGAGSMFLAAIFYFFTTESKVLRRME